MTIRKSCLLVLSGAVFFGGAEAGTTSLSILSPPDGFFSAEGVLEVTVVHDAPGRGRGSSLHLLIDGEEVAVAGPGGGTGRRHTFRVPIPGPVSLIQAVSARGRGGGDGDVATVRGAGLREFRLLRATMEEMEEIAAAIEGYRGSGGHPAPEDLAVLVPAFLMDVPTRSPLGTPYEYDTDGSHFRIHVLLPGQGEVLIEDGTFVAFPAGAISDREAARLVREQLTLMAFALESFRVDHTSYPERLEDVVPVFLSAIPPVDPYGNPYQAEVGRESYRLVSFGRDGRAGGTGFDADTVMETEVFLAGSTTYRGRREYLEKALRNLRSLSRLVSFTADQTGRFPVSLAELDEYVGRGARFDLCGNPYRYETQTWFGGEQVYFLSADGCDGVRGTDTAEPEISGFHPPRCGAPASPLFLPAFSGLFD